MASICNNMDRQWSFFSLGWKETFSLQPKEFRTLTPDELEEVKSNDGVQQMLEQGMLSINETKKDMETVDTVAKTMKKGRKNLDTETVIPETKIAVKTEIKSGGTLEIPADA